MLDRVKKAIPLKSDYYDDVIESLIASAIIDLGIVGVHVDRDSADAIETQAIATYVKMNFADPTNYADLKSAYDELKAQLITARGYGL